MALRVLSFCVLAGIAARAESSHNPARTATVFVHGFDPSGAAQSGVFGADEVDPLLEQAAALLGLPTTGQPGGLERANVVTTTRYYGDTPPPYYEGADLADLNAVTLAWGGGVPRYALIVAKYARHVLEVSGADQINIMSASFGSLIARWLIEKDVEHLASQGRIARWLSVEGVLAGNWAASQEDLVGLSELVQAPTIDVEHMGYDWVEAHLHAPRREADSAWYASILLGQVGSTEDRLHERALTAAMLSRGAYQPNDGLQGLWDARFATVTDRARFLGRPPTWSVFHDTHFSLQENQAAWAQAVLFLTQSRRVTVTLRAATVHDLHEPSSRFLDLRPAEVVFQSRVRSPALAARWGITDAISELTLEGGAPPLRRFERAGDRVEFDQIVFDDFVLAEETVLDLELWAEEIDLELRYGVTETFFEPYFQFLAGGFVQVSVLHNGAYSFVASDWQGDLEVRVFDYPFGVPTDAVTPPSRRPGDTALLVAPNPFVSQVRIRPAWPTAAGSGNTTHAGTRGDATLRIYDASGRLLRALVGPAEQDFLWDGRDRRGTMVPAGAYFYELVTPNTVFTGRGHRLR